MIRDIRWLRRERVTGSTFDGVDQISEETVLQIKLSDDPKNKWRDVRTEKDDTITIPEEDEDVRRSYRIDKCVRISPRGAEGSTPEGVDPRPPRKPSKD